MFWLALLLQTEVPKGIAYNPAADAINAPIQRLLAKSFDGSDAGFGADLYGDAVVVGPTLWNEIDNFSTIKNANVTAAVFMIGHQGSARFGLRGAIFKDEEVNTALRPALLLLAKASQPFAVRKLAPAEMKHIWTINVFKSIDEPVFALESPSRTFILDFFPHPEVAPKGAPYRVYFIDELAPAERQSADVVP